MKIVCMIPARLGSKRIPNKNIRLLDGKPLIRHVLDKAFAAGCFDEIYVNSPDEIFKEFCKGPNVNFYKRHEALGSDDAKNDEFLSDFMANIDADYIVQINTTSPCITIEDIQKFVRDLVRNDYVALHGMKQVQIEAIYNGRALNFNPKDIMPRSQDLKPVFLFASGIMGWTVKNFKNTYGGGHDIGAFILKGFSAIDIDTEEDWQLAELAIRAQKELPKLPKYYGEGNDLISADVPKILADDGVCTLNFNAENRMVTNVPLVIHNYRGKDPSWAHRVINTESNSATLICQQKGEGNRMHHHYDWNEWWYIVKGHWIFTIEKDGTDHQMHERFETEDIHVSEGDLVFIKKGKRHKITADGLGPNVRLAVSRADVDHVYA